MLGLIGFFAYRLRCTPAMIFESFALLIVFFTKIIDENGTRDRVHQILGFGKVTAPSTAQDLPQDRPGPAKNPFGTRPRIRPGSIQGLGEGRADLVNAAGIFADICRLAKDISGPHCMLPSRLTSPG